MISLPMGSAGGAIPARPLAVINQIASKEGQRSSFLLIRIVNRDYDFLFSYVSLLGGRQRDYGWG